MMDAKTQNQGGVKRAKGGANLPPAFDEAVATNVAQKKNQTQASNRRGSAVAAGGANSANASTSAPKSTAGKTNATSAGKAPPTAAGAITPAGKGTPAKKPPAKAKNKKKKKLDPRSCRARFTRFVRGLYMSYVNCCISTPCYSFDVYKWSSEAADFRSLFSKLGLAEREVGVFYVFYSRMDQDHSGAISIYELLDFLNVERTDFSRRVFAIFDEDGNGTIDFREFVVALWNYATLTPSSLVLFSFDMYDKDGSGVLELAEIKKMLVEVYGEQYASNPHARQMVLDLHEKMGVALGMPVYVKVAEFEAMCRNRPAMLMPAFIFQDALRSRICGNAFWQACMSKRLQLSNGEYVSIATLMQAAVNEDIAKGVIAVDRVGKDHELATTNSQALNFMKSIGGNLARRRGSNDLGRDKIREALDRAKARDAEKATQKLQGEPEPLPSAAPNPAPSSATLTLTTTSQPLLSMPNKEKKPPLVQESSLDHILTKKHEKNEKTEKKPK